jgi:hypothetical protein
MYADGEEECQPIRQRLVNEVIATDIDERELCCERKGRWEKAFHLSTARFDDFLDRQATIVFEYIIQASDVAHTMQHRNIFRKWNERFAAYSAGRAPEDPFDNWYDNEISISRRFGVSGDAFLNYHTLKKIARVGSQGANHPSQTGIQVPV